MNIKELEKEFHKKLDKEFDDFIKKLELKKDESITDTAYEIVIKQQIKDILQERDFEKNELNVLLKNKGILNDCYNEWMDTDANFTDVIEFAVDNCIDVILEDAA